MRIRKIKRKDYLAVEKLLMQLHQVHKQGRPELFVDVEHQYSPEYFSNLISNHEIISILAEIDCNVAGVCFASMLNKSGMVHMKTIYIDEIVVDVHHRREGIGRALFQEVERRAKKCGAKRLDLMVWSFNEDAIKFYESYGMTPQRYIYEKNMDNRVI